MRDMQILMTASYRKAVSLLMCESVSPVIVSRTVNLHTKGPTESCQGNRLGERSGKGEFLTLLGSNGFMGIIGIEEKVREKKN